MLLLLAGRAAAAAAVADPAVVVVVVVVVPVVPSCELLTISCLVSDDLVPGPGFVRLIFILRPGSTVAECTAAAAILAAAAAPLLLFWVVVVVVVVAVEEEEEALVLLVVAAAAPLTTAWVGDEPAEAFGLVPLGIPDAAALLPAGPLFFSMSASKSIIRLPMPTSHSESSYSKLVGSPDRVGPGAVVVVVGATTTAPRESGRASSSPAAASGPDSFIGPAQRRERRLRARARAQPSSRHHFFG